MQSNLWSATSRNDLSTPAPAAGKHYDAIVIGGGFTGINCALKLAEENLTVALFDAEHIGYGGSGRNVGLVNGGLWMEPDKVETALGTAAGKKLNALLGAGPELVLSLIDTHRIDCDPIRNGTLHCAHSQAGLRQLESRLRQHKQRGVKVELISSDETAVKVGTDLYHGALHYQDVGTIQPLAYLLGLARVAETKGVQIHQHSPVSSMTYQGNKWCVQTGDASVYSDAVIVATNAYLNRLVLPQKTSLTPIHYF